MRSIDFILETLSHFVKQAEGPPPGVPAHASPDFDSELTWLCEWNGITPIVVESLEKLALRPEISRISFERMRALSKASATLGAELLGTTESLTGALQAVNIDSLMMDDVLLPLAVYPSPPTRPVDKITLLVKEQDFGRVIEVCGEAGFQRSTRDPNFVSGREAVIYHHYFSPCVLINGKGDHLHLEFRLFDLGRTVDAEEAWENEWAMSGSGGATRRISIEDQLIRSCVAYNMTAFSKLLFAVDIGLILTGYGPELNWHYIESRVRSRALYPAVSLTLKQVVRWLKLDGRSVALPAPGPLRRELFDIYWHPGWVGSALKRPTHPRRLRFYLLESGRLSDKLRIVFTLLSPQREWVASFFERSYQPWLKVKFIVLALRNRLGIRAK